jgi:hypothetical protein
MCWRACRRTRRATLECCCRIAGRRRTDLLTAAHGRQHVLPGRLRCARRRPSPCWPLVGRWRQKAGTHFGASRRHWTSPGHPGGGNPCYLAWASSSPSCYCSRSTRSLKFPTPCHMRNNGPHLGPCKSMSGCATPGSPTTMNAVHRQLCWLHLLHTVAGWLTALQVYQIGYRLPCHGELARASPRGVGQRVDRPGGRHVCLRRVRGIRPIAADVAQAVG